MPVIPNCILFLLLLAVPLHCAVSVAKAEPLLFVSSQFTPLNEAEIMRRTILNNFSMQVDFRPDDDRIIFSELVKNENKSSGYADLIGGVHGDFPTMIENDVLLPFDNLLDLNSLGVIDSLCELGRSNNKQYYIPWVQATYIMVAHRKSLEYLPQNAELQTLTYEQLLQWAQNMKKATGKNMLGFPSGRNGLMHRFLQGYLYPSFTGRMIQGFDSPQAVEMWQYMKRLWEFVNPRSLNFNRMDDPMQLEHVWVAWDHVARISTLFRDAPENYVAFPAPYGPKGRGFMTVLVGLAIPKKSKRVEDSVQLIRYLLDDTSQRLTLEGVGFFPVITTPSTKTSSTTHSLTTAVHKQLTQPNGITSILPVGLGERNMEFNTIFMATFSRIVLRNKNIDSILNDQMKRITAVIEEAGANYWPPDVANNRPYRKQ